MRDEPQAAPPRTSITLSNGYGRYSVELEQGDMTLPDIMDLLVIPALLAAGYRHDTISDYFGES